MHQPMHPDRSIHHSKAVQHHQHSPSSHHLTSTTPTTRSHSISSSSVSSATSIPHYSFSMHSTATTNSPSTHTNAVTNHSLSNQIPSKYDFGHTGTGASLHSTQSTSAPNTNYIHSANNLQTQLPYSNVKSETNSTTSNYDYMNNFVQNGYFNSSYGTAITGSPAAVTHPVSDLASYHHIQAAKLMATS